MHRIFVSLAMSVACGISCQTPAFSQEYRGTYEQQMACTPDVFRLCGAQIQQAVPRGVRVQGKLKCKRTAAIRAAAGPTGYPIGLRIPLALDPQQTSTHSAATSSAIRDGAIRTALWIEPAAGTTSSNSFNEISQ